MNEGTSPVRGILLTHGAMCHGLADAVHKITGVAEEALVAVSNEGRGPEALNEAVREAAGEGPAIVFTDLQTGSCALAARFVCRDPGNRRVVFGTNLPMLLDFVFHRDLPLDELVERLLEKGRSGIRTLERTEAGADRSVPRG
jgi:N-acetylgalactosamine PTS system EIIA component